MMSLQGERALGEFSCRVVACLLCCRRYCCSCTSLTATLHFSLSLFLSQSVSLPLVVLWLQTETWTGAVWANKASLLAWALTDSLPAEVASVLPVGVELANVWLCLLSNSSMHSIFSSASQPVSPSSFLSGLALVTDYLELSFSCSLFASLFLCCIMECGE